MEDGRTRALRSLRWVALAAATTALIIACAHRTVVPAPEDPGPDTPVEPYTIGIKDVLRISVWQNEAVTVDVPVRPDGKVSVPLIDDIPAKGLTPVQLKEAITRELSKYVANPDVTVIVLQMNSRYVNVVGRVGATMRVPLTEDLRVTEAIAMAGGFDEFADRSDIRVVRRLPDGSEVEYHFDYDAYMKGRAPGTNFLLKSGDTIYVPD